jgi:hypothetical protein
MPVSTDVATAAREALNRWTREVVAWHFDPSTGTPFWFPFVTVVECPERQMPGAIGPTLVCTAITDDGRLRRELLDAVHIDRLNLGPIPTTQLNWRQPHEGNIVEFLFRARSLQMA